MAFSDAKLREMGEGTIGELVTREEGSRRRTTDAGEWCQLPRAHSQGVNRRPQRVFARQRATDFARVHEAARIQQGTNGSLKKSRVEEQPKRGGSSKHAPTHKS